MTTHRIHIRKLGDAQLDREIAQARLEAAVLEAAAAGMTQREIASVLGISHQAVGKYLRRRRR
jgi:predicted transcriptional regulator